MQHFWDDLFGQDDYVYGQEPNSYFKTCLDSLERGQLLLPCEGEGRQAVYAAQQAWYTYAFDSSQEAQRKALALAKKYFVQIGYELQDIEDVMLQDEKFDCAAIIFAHFPKDKQAAYYRKIVDAIKPGGHIIVELFAKEQLKYESGGPKNEEMLMDEVLMREYFSSFDFLDFSNDLRELNEGFKHQGTASTYRLFGKKVKALTQEPIQIEV